MPQITIELEAEPARRLEEIARQSEMTVEELVRSATLTFLQQREQAFEATLEQVVARNRELYRRLA